MPFEADGASHPQFGGFGGKGGRGLDPASIWFTLLLGGMSALPPLSIDMGLPALPSLAADLHAMATGAGLTLSLFVGGFAFAQLLFGPLSDRFGRRPVLIGGCVLFTIGGAGCAAASSIGAVMALRFVQGAGGGAGTVLAMAIVRDTFEGAAARARLSYVMMVLSVAPIVAPTLGGLLLPFGGWRAIYAALALGGLALTGVVTLRLQETNRLRDRAAIQPARLLRNYRHALGSRACGGNALVGGLVFGCMFAYVTASPLVLLGIYHLPTAVYGLLFALTAGAIMAGAAVAGQLAGRHVAPDVPVIVGLVLCAGSSVSLLGLTLMLRSPSLFVMMPLLVANTFCMGLVSPNITHAAIEGLPHIAGVATAVIGCVRMLGGALSSAMVGVFFPSLGLIALPTTMTLLSCGAAAVWWLIARPAAQGAFPASRG